MHVRELVTGDESQYLAMRVRATDETPVLMASEAGLRELTAAWWARPGLLYVYKQEGQGVLGVFDEQVLVGAIVMNARQEPLGYAEVELWGLYVVPKMRGTPASGMLLSHALQWCRQQPDKRIVRAVFAKSNEQAKRFFDRHYFATSDARGLRGAALARHFVFMEYAL